MSERKFARVKGKVGSAAQVREEVSKHVRSKTIYQNKSLLIDCNAVEGEPFSYSSKRYFSLRRVPPADGEESLSSNGSLLEEGPYPTLFVKECLKTYSTPFLELEDEEEEKTVQDFSKQNGNHDKCDGEVQMAPPWFWNTWTQSRPIQLDEAGIALEGRLGIILNSETLGERLLQLKWDSSEEKFYLLVWSFDAGGEILWRGDLPQCNPSFRGESILDIKGGALSLTASSEKGRALLRDLYTSSVELGCYDKSASLASRENVQRADNVVSLFQRAVTCGPVKNGRSWTKVRIKADHSPDLSLRSIHPLRAPSPSQPFQPGTFFKVRLDYLEFRLRTESASGVEPYYICLTLYDVKNGKKISEDFHTKVKVDGNVSEKEDSSSTAIFKVSEPNDQIFLVMRVEKTLQPLSETEAYFRSHPEPKTGTKMAKQVSTSPLFTEVGHYRTPLCWGCRSIFRKSGADCSGYVLDISPTSDSSFGPFYKYEKYSEEELLKTLQEIRKPEKVSKLSIVPGLARLFVESIGEKGAPLCSKPVLEFPINSTDNFKRFIHVLYVHPQGLNLTSLTGKLRARNILCRVFLRAEDDVEASPLEDRPSSGLLSTFVLHHRSTPEWYSEIRIPLPVALDPRLHLLFQFFHISCSFENKGKGGKQVENPIGFAWTPLINKFRFIGGEHTLPISASLPSGYLQIIPLGLGKGTLEDSRLLPNILRRAKRLSSSQFSGPDITWLDAKCTFSLKLHLLSTVWTRCGSLGAFFAHAEKFFQKGQTSARVHCDDETTIKVLRSLEGIDLSTLRDFFPTIANQVTHIAAVTFAKSVSTACLKFLLFSFHTLTEAGLGGVVQEYVTSRFLSTSDEEGGSPSKGKLKEQNMGETLLSSWIDLFETGDGATVASSLEHSRSLFSLIVKAVAVQGLPKSDSDNNLEENKLLKLVQLFTSEVVHRCQGGDQPLSKKANENLVFFISALLSVLGERHLVFGAINSYLACFGPGDSHKVQDFKFSLLQALVEHPLFISLNSAEDEEEWTRMENANWCRRHFLVATVMKQCRSGLGEVSTVRTQALKVIMLGLGRHEASGSSHPMWIPWLRVVCDNLHRITKIINPSSRCSSVSTVLSSTTSTLVHQALIKSISGQGHEGHNHGGSTATHGHGHGHHHHSRESSQLSIVSLPVPRHGLMGSESARSSSLSLNLSMNLNNTSGKNVSPTISQKSSMTSLNMNSDLGDRLSLDRMSFGNHCDYLDAISAIKTSNPDAVEPPTVSSSMAPSTTGSDSETIVNELASNGSGETQDHLVINGGSGGSDEGSGGDPDSSSMKMRLPQITTPTTLTNGVNNRSASDVDKSNVVQRRYDKLGDDESRPLLIGGLYLLKKMMSPEGQGGLKVFWQKSSPSERASLLQMLHLASSQFTYARKNSTITKTKVVGISVPPPTMPPSPRSGHPGKKWSSLPTNSKEGLCDIANAKEDPQLQVPLGKGPLSFDPSNNTNEWKSLNTETTFICIDTLSNLSQACKGDDAELREVIRTCLNVAKAAEDTRAMLATLQNLYKVDDLATIVFAKGNEDLTHQLFCELLTGFGTSYLINICVLIISKLFLFDPSRTTSQSLLAIASLSMSQAFVHNFRRALTLLEKNMSISDRSSFLISITEKLSFIDDATSTMPRSNSARGGKNKSSQSRALDLSNRLHTVIDSLWVLRSCSNEYKVPELYLKLANSYSNFARGGLRIEALDSLKGEHLGRKKYSEALICELHVAARLARQSKARSQEVRRVMLGISENLRDEFRSEDDDPTSDISSDLENDPLLAEGDYTEELIERLEACVLLAEKAERYELMLEVYRILVEIQESSCDYAALEHSYTQMARACKLIQNKRERFHGTYYRVAIYKQEKDEEGKRRAETYIYKEPNVTSLMEICHKVESAEGAVILQGDSPSILDNLPSDDGKVYASITHVSPLPSDSPRGKVWSEEFRRHQNVQRFSYDTPFAVKSHDKISVDNKAAVHQQWKRRTTVRTEYTFPAVVSRLRIVESREEDLSPIIVAIDDMQRRVIELRSEFGSQDIKRIQLRLQGSISVQVNQGPLAYARAFLEKENEYPAQDIHKLKAIYRDFVECCRELLIKNGAMIPPEQQDYQMQLESDYTRLIQVLNPFLGLGHLDLGINRISRISTINSY